jgi:hypothetical protein
MSNSKINYLRPSKANNNEKLYDSLQSVKTNAVKLKTNSCINSFFENKSYTQSDSKKERQTLTSAPLRDAIN